MYKYSVYVISKNHLNSSDLLLFISSIKLYITVYNITVKKKTVELRWRSLISLSKIYYTNFQCYSVVQIHSATTYQLHEIRHGAQV